jgi:hypothetical protein
VTPPGIAGAHALLDRWGLLLLHDRSLPSLSAQIAGEPIRGSWWSHPKGREIFRAMGELADDPDVALVKLVSAKVTFVHRRLWPTVMAAGMAREPWQMDGLSAAARTLLGRIDEDGETEASGPPAREIETRLLAASREVHTGSGAHRMRLMRWDAFAEARRQPLPAGGAEDTRSELDALIGRMNAEYGAAAGLPWTGRV